MEVSGRWCIVTAGHVLNQIATYLKAWPTLSHRFVLYASFGTFTTKMDLLEFNHRNPIMCEDQSSGLDFGAILLTHSEQATLQGFGVFAVEEKYWDQELTSQFQEFGMLGLPLQNMELNTPGEAGIQPVYICLEPTTDLPDTYKPHTDPMYYFKIMEPSRSDLDIDGMSGCPVFAFYQPRQSDDYKALIIAMQNSWVEGRRIIATTNLRFAGRLLKEKLR